MSQNNKSMIPLKYLSVGFIFKNLRFCKGEMPYISFFNMIRTIALISLPAIFSAFFISSYMSDSESTLIFTIVAALFFISCLLFLSSFIFYDFKIELANYLEKSGRIEEFCAMHEKNSLIHQIKKSVVSAPPRPRL